MAEQLRVERRDHDRIEIQRAQFVHLLAPHLEEMRRVRFRGALAAAPDRRVPFRRSRPVIR